MSRKILSLVLALIMVFSMTATALAGTFTYTADKTVLEAGESVDVTITLDEDIAGVTGLQYKLLYNDELFEMTGSKAGNVISGVKCTDVSGKSYVNIMWYDADSEVQTLKAGTLATVTFAAATSITEESEAEFKLQAVGLSDENSDPINDGAVSGDPISITVSPAPEKTPFAAVTYFNEDFEEVRATVRSAGEFSYAGGYAIVPLYVMQIPYGYEDVCYMLFDEDESFQYTYASADGGQTYWDYETTTQSWAEIDFTLGDYFTPQFGEGWSVAPEFALTWEYDPATVPVPEYEMLPEDITFNPTFTSQETRKLENDIYQVDVPGHAFGLGYSVAGMPEEYEIKDFEWKYTDPRGVVKTVGNNNVLFSDLFSADFGMGSVQLTINYWPITHDENAVKTCVKSAQFYYGPISTSISQSAATMNVGDQLTLSAQHTVPATIVWNSSDKNVATVVNGVVQAVGTGTANITATANGKTATCAVTVEAKEALTDAKIVCKNRDGEYIEVGESFILHSQGRVGVPWRNSAYMYVMNGDEILTDVEWKIADTSVAHEDTNNNPGAGGFILNTSICRKATTTLTATLADGTELSCLIRIVTYAGKIYYDTSMATINQKDQSRYWVAEAGETLTPVYTLSLDGNALTEEELADNTVEWRTTNETVAKFENGAYVFAEGTAEIYGVIKGYVDGEAVELEGERITVYVGSQYPKNAKLVYEDGTDVPKSHVVNNFGYAITSVAEEGKKVVKLVGIPEASTENVVVTAVSSGDANSVTASRSGNTITLSGVAKTAAPVKVTVNWTKNVGDISASMAHALYVNVVEKPACEHTDTETACTPAGDEQHTVTVTCKDCGETISTTAEDCADAEPKDGKCDLCGGDVACKHTDTTVSTEYAVGNGTHALVTKVVCGDCGETTVTTGESEACFDGDQNGKCDVCGNPVGDHADMNVSAETVEHGDTVQMMISVENDQNAASEYNSYEFVVSYNSAHLTYNGFACSNDENCAVIEKDGKLIVNGYGKIKNVSENAFVTLNFSAKNSGEEAVTAEIKLEKAYRDTSEMAINRDIDEIEVETSSKTVTIEPAAVEYEVTFSETVKVNGVDTTSVKAEAGETVTFDIISQTGMDVTVTGATKVDEDTYQVTVTENTEVTITYTAKTFEVKVSGSGKENVTINQTATYGKDFVFEVTKETGYNYEVSATVNGSKVDMIIDGNAYTIKGEDVTGMIEIVVSKDKAPDGPAPEEVDVFTNTNGGENVKVDSVVENDEYIYMIPATHNVYKVTVGGEEINVTFNSEGNLHLPAGTAADDVVIYLGEIYEASTQLSDGSSAAAAVILPEKKPSYGTDYTFSIADGYKLDNVVIGETATVAEGDDPVYTDNGDGTYTISGTMISGDIVIIAHKIVYAASVDVYDYVKTNGDDDGAAVIQLVVASASQDVAEGEILQYNGENMFWSSEYNAYAYLVIVEEDKDLLTKEAAADLIGAAEAEAAEIVYNGNVNMTANNVVDVNDAQLVYDIYKAMYNNFEKVSMEKMLRADMNGDHVVNVSDVTAVVAIANTK